MNGEQQKKLMSLPSGMQSTLLNYPEQIQQDLLALPRDELINLLEQDLPSDELESILLKETQQKENTLPSFLKSKLNTLSPSSKSSLLLSLSPESLSSYLSQYSPSQIESHLMQGGIDTLARLDKDTVEKVIGLPSELREKVMELGDVE